MIKITSNGKIHTDELIFSSWAEVEFFVKALRVNAQIIFGNPLPTNRTSPPSSAKVLRLVKSPDDKLV